MDKNTVYLNLRTAHQQLWNDLADLPQEVAAQSLHNKWSILQHTDHLNRSLKGITRYMGMDKAEIAEKFGHGDPQLFDADGLIQRYYDETRSGAVATGFFVPEPDSQRDLLTLIVEGRQYLDQMGHALDHWTETELNSYLCPHPILKFITARETLHFAAFHATHHHRSIVRLAEQIRLMLAL